MNEIQLDSVLLAVADPTRRSILAGLAAGPKRVTQIAEPFPISLNSVSKHIRILERANLVSRRRVGKEHILSINPTSLDDAAAWIEEQRTLWAWRFQTLDALIQKEEQ